MFIFCWKCRTSASTSNDTTTTSNSDGSSSEIFDPGQVRSIFCCSGWVGSGQPSLVWFWIWKISPKNTRFFNFFPSGQKKISSDRVKKYLGQTWVCLLFTASQKYAWDKLGEGPSLHLRQQSYYKQNMPSLEKNQNFSSK